MNLSTSILGSAAVKSLQATTNAYVLEVGSDRLTRAQLAAVGCYNFTAARHLSRTLGETGATSLRQLYEGFGPRDLALPQLGVISLAVLGAAFEARGIGGDAPLESWARKHAPSAGKAMVTFYTTKKRAATQAATERKAATARTRGRRAQAHRLRSARFSLSQPQHGTA